MFIFCLFFYCKKLASEATDVVNLTDQASDKKLANRIAEKC